MKICLVSDYLVGFHQNWSGAEMVCDFLSDLLEKEGQDVFFFTSKIQKEGKPAKICQIPTMADTGAPKFLKRIIAPVYFLAYFLAGFVCAFYYFGEKKPDVVNFLHSNYLFLPIMAAAKLRRIPTVFTFLDYYSLCPRGSFYSDGKICQAENCSRCVSKTKFLEGAIIKKFSKRVDGLITFTESSKKRLVKYGFRPDKIKIIYTYGIPNEFRRKKIKPAADNVLVVASFHEHKGLHIILQSWPVVLLFRPDAKLNIIGSGPQEDKERIERLVEELEISDSVNFLGRKDNEEVLNNILKNEIVAVPEQWPSEFGPLALLEAMALGRPVAAGRIGSAPDFIEEGISGSLAEYNQPKDFAKKIIWLLQNKSRLKKIGEKAREAGKILFARDQGRKTVNFYQELCKK